MMKAPDFDRSPLDESASARIKELFSRGIADDISPEKMVRAGVFQHYPLSGGIFNRRESVKYIVLHSTETGIPVPAKNVVNGWNSMGRRHPGAQYVVDRDGTILQALDPDLASVHVNIFKTLPGINNDNTIGIEMNHTGMQNYPQAQRTAVIRLLTYLQQRFNVSSENVITHRYAQQGDHTDPVNFDLDNFLANKENFRTQALALKRSTQPAPASDEENEDDAPLASVYVQIHGPLPLPSLSSAAPANLKSASPIAMPKGTFVAGGASPRGESLAPLPGSTPQQP
ncbi:MAG: peptidoglycan recognition protein family protein [Candidatus Obscuribacterales bacterium]|nr:peptidoglycan recognition protein family protein [Candidatus Obscuribacterales bacterium]